MNTKKRNLMVTIEHAHGMKLDDLAAKYKLNRSRIHQIYWATIKSLGLKNSATARDIGLAIQRIEGRARSERPTMEDYRYTTPEQFHRELQIERENDTPQYYFGYNS